MSSAAAVEKFFAAEDHLRQVCEALDEATTDEARAEIAPLVGAYLTEAEGNRDEFVELLNYLASQAAHVDLEVERLRQRRERIERIQQSLRSAAISMMQATGATRLEGRSCTLSLRRNPPSLLVVDDKQIPQQYWREKVTVDIDKSAVKEALKRGDQVPGADLSYGFRLEVK